MLKFSDYFNDADLIDYYNNDENDKDACMFSS